MTEPISATEVVEPSEDSTRMITAKVMGSRDNPNRYIKLVGGGSRSLLGKLDELSSHFNDFSPWKKDAKFTAGSDDLGKHPSLYLNGESPWAAMLAIHRALTCALPDGVVLSYIGPDGKEKLIQRDGSPAASR